MSFGDSKAIITNQDGINENLADIVNKHLTTEFKKPISTHTQQAFDQVNELVQGFNGPIILDSCCGVGQSTRIIAKQNPDALVIGVDKSDNRITRNVDDQWQVENYHLVRADLNDFYRLVVQENWPVEKHYILYPNPWPKAKHVKRRWHGSAVFPYIIQVGKTIELRSNWRLYLEEFQAAMALANIDSQLNELPAGEPLTPFEAKYLASEQQCWALTAKIS
ncbi:tRNA (guanine(46)-N(7))-methyltransferase TrmB [Thalassomonas sp. M1454]|uniref:tRNA (guanine(46)-N(7))-methyltransferase TrmB n=1 Tax=Thalassomonas sp. M1454 TaxID=2594477 RepID=UPI00117E7719|nr:SAM-dependent methyltransferase [Thalassomonas sp. M1454]TRX52475.1 SAM-dependent methyltransferase [Thalassomonas sp. M1454]